MNNAQLSGRGRGSGGVLMLLGAWGAVIPFVGPYFGYSFTPDKAWAYTSGRLWLSIVPGAAALLGGLFVFASARMATAGAFLAALGGAWFVLGQSVVAVAFSGDAISAGSPVASSGSTPGAATMRFLEGFGFFYGLGVVILFFAALALGRARSARRAARTGAWAHRGRPDDPETTENLYHSTY